MAALITEADDLGPAVGEPGGYDVEKGVKTLTCDP